MTEVERIEDRIKQQEEKRMADKKEEKEKQREKEEEVSTTTALDSYFIRTTKSLKANNNGIT